MIFILHGDSIELATFSFLWILLQIVTSQLLSPWISVAPSSITFEHGIPYFSCTLPLVSNQTKETKSHVGRILFGYGSYQELFDLFVVCTNDNKSKLELNWLRRKLSIIFQNIFPDNDISIKMQLQLSIIMNQSVAWG